MRGVKKMSKYFSKALLYTDKKTLISSFIAYSVFLIFGLLAFILALYRSVSLDDFKQINILNIEAVNPSYIAINMYVVFIVICIVTIVNLYNDKDKKYYYMLTQPYTRDSIIITKTIGAAISYVIPIVVYGIVCIIIMTVNHNYYGIYYTQIASQLLVRLLTLIILLTFITVFIQLMQMLFGRCMNAVVLPPILYFMLFLSSTIMGQFISKKIDFLRQLNNSIAQYVFNLQELLYLMLRYIDKPYWLASIMFSLASAAIVYITILLNRKVAAENTFNMFMFKSSETVFKIVFTLFITLVSTLFISGVLYYICSSVKGINYSTYLMQKYGISGKENIEQNLYLVLNLLWIPVFTLIYKVYGKILNIRRAI